MFNAKISDSELFGKIIPNFSGKSNLHSEIKEENSHSLGSRISGKMPTFATGFNIFL